MRYVVTRYYFDSFFKAIAEENFIKDIQANPVIKYGDFSYAIGHVEHTEEEGLDLIFGQIGRIPAGKEGFVYDTSTKDFIRSAQGEFADCILDFCAIPKKHILLIQFDYAFEPAAAKNMFKRIYLQSNQSYVSSFGIDFVFDDRDVYEEIKDWQRFTKVEFKDLRPSNPDPSDEYAFIEELIKEAGSTRTKLELKAEAGDDGEESINMESKLVRQGLALSANGYGKAEISGVDGSGQFDKVTTYKYKKVIDIDFREDGTIAKIKRVVEKVGSEDGDENTDRD